MKWINLLKFKHFLYFFVKNKILQYRRILMKSILTIFAAILALTASARTVTYEVGLFDQISQFGDLNIVYTCNPDSVGLATFESDDSVDFTEALELTNNKGKLTIKEVPGHQLGQIPTIHVYSGSINHIKSEGKGSVTAFLAAATPTFSVSLTGNGRVVCENINSTDVSASITTGNGTIALRGKCTDASYRLVGTGTIQADGLAAKNVKCTAAGTGTIGCDASLTLDLRTLGSTKVYYTGNPEIKKIGNPKIYPLSPKSNLNDMQRTPLTVDEEDDDVTVVTIGDEEDEIEIVDVETVNVSESGSESDPDEEEEGTEEETEEEIPDEE